MFLSMLYMATRRVSWIVIGLTLFIGGCVAIYPFFSHLQLRVRIWLDPFNPDYIFGDSFQLVQGLIAMNDGGLLGNGPGTGNPNIISYAESDFILAAIGEELADVIGYGLALANELNLDVSDAIRAKMVKNAQKYPADEFRGRYGREDKGRFTQR